MPLEARVSSARPTPSSEAVHQRMSRQARRDTAPEIALRRALHRRGLRFRVNLRPTHSLRGAADVVFPKARVVVFVDGCFWHMCPEHSTMPASNAEWWRAKLEGNRARDRRTDELLREEGWTVVRIWEHEDPEAAAGRVAEIVRLAREHTNARSRSVRAGP
ncbi:MAG TPA: very short patch repair endonuclease [Baekduia sp.]|nr:very short patch repair endonuclease [Baekduia sp.]